MTKRCILLHLNVTKVYNTVQHVFYSTAEIMFFCLGISDGGGYEAHEIDSPGAEGFLRCDR